MGVAVKTRLGEDFRKYGMVLVDFYINRITPPEEVQKRIDDRAGMAAVGDLDKYLKFKAATAMGDAGASGGGASGGAAASMAAGIGAGMGMMIPGMLYKVLGPGSENMTPEKIAQKGLVNCPECHGEVALDSRFCAHCGHQMVIIKKCFQCEKNVTANSKFCPSCGADLSAGLSCRHCQAKLPPGTKYCLNCGEPTSPKQGSPPV
jgi:membrane protease subunit (stomatin/prohibitin family)